jgi:hypothetical protein
MNRILTFTLSALMLSAPALAQTAPEQPPIYKDKPNGSGDPGAMSCYRPLLSDSRVNRLECKHNSEWARIYADDHRDNLVDTGKMATAPVNIVH